MKNIKRALAALLCVIICLSFGITAYATTNNTKITVSSVTAMPGETVTIDIKISNNPGIMAMAFCITYDNDALVYKDFKTGYVSGFTIKNHTDKGHISLVNVENKDIATDGTIISITFDVLNKAKPGRHPITIVNSNRDKHGSKLHNSFSNSKQQFVVPSVISGGVTVQETCENSGHKYGDWTILNEANCTETGLKKHTCSRCGLVDEVVIPITHDFESDWTIDKAATPTEDGVMSRHCTKCDEVTDKTTFRYEEIGDDTGDTSDDSSGDNSLDSSLESNGTSGDTDSQEGSYAETTTSSTQSNNSTQKKPSKKPIVNNVVGEKVPLQEVEKLEDYQQNIKPNLNGTSSQDGTSENTSSKTESDSSDATTGVIENEDVEKQEKEPAFFTSPSGIATTVISSLLSVGIIVLGIVLIIRNKNSNQ